MMKVRQKISGCFRTAAGAENFATLRTVLSTAGKQGWSLIEPLQEKARNALIAKNQNRLTELGSYVFLFSTLWLAGRFGMARPRASDEIFDRNKRIPAALIVCGFEAAGKTASQRATFGPVHRSPSSGGVL